ncbi:MAG: hypothetical protein QOH86_976 [Sphingomonadales bacterium]|nr:hypothetical protein [Sphingomonadales bacterium]
MDPRPDGEAPGAPEASWQADENPLRRFAASTLDFHLFSFVGLFLFFLPLLAAGVPGVDWLIGGSIFATYLLLDPLATILAAFAVALCLAWWGCTPGKWLFGLRVARAEDGAPLGLRRALRREAMLALWGVGLGLPLIQLLMLLRSYDELENRPPTLWDRSAGSVVLARPVAGLQLAGVVLGTVLLVALKIWDLIERLSRGGL